ncbi:uncharacterized protein LOC144058110 [Vanacampus margaritifer]
MSSRGPNDLCVICGGVLQGNQRRWLFGGQQKKSSQLQTPTRSLKGESLSGSSPSSPWGSMSSLVSSSSLSKSHLSLSSLSKSLDVLSVLTHILGRPVQRSAGRGEFVCGKCSGVLERIFRFDTVIARVKALSSERLNKLTQERDSIRRWVRSNYVHRHPQEQDEEAGGDEDKDDYRDMLKDNMALAEYECWSEKWDTCPYFIRTGKRCRKGQNCEGCDSLRVSDSDYESVCGVPRRMPYQAFSPLPLSRDKSQSMPLHWHRIQSTCSSPGSLTASTFSLRTQSVQSLDSLDDGDPFDSPGDQSVTSSLLRELRHLGGTPVRSPAGSKIPVLAGRSKSRSCSEMTSPVVSRSLSFGENGDHRRGEEKEDDDDVLMEMKDEFLPLHQQSASRRLHQVIRHLRGQLDQAESRVRSLEAQLEPRTPQDDCIKDWKHIVREEDGASLLPDLARSLHSRDRLIQECMSVIKRMCVEGGGKSQLADEVANKLGENLKEIVNDNKVAMESLMRELAEKGRHLEEEVTSLKKAAGDREKDLETLNMVLQCNQDIIDDLRAALGEKQRLLQELEKEREVWKQRDRALAATMQEQDEVVRLLKVELESCMKDIQALSDSVIGQGLEGGGAEASLASQLRDKQSRLAAMLEERESQSATLCQEVTKLTAALQEYQNVVQSQQESYDRTTSALTARLTDARRALRNEEHRRKEAERMRHNQREDGERADRKLRDSLEKRDRLIQQILQDAEERDRQVEELQHNLQKKRDEFMSAVKHAL